MGYFSHYHNTYYYFHMNIPLVNTGMLIIIETYDWLIYPLLSQCSIFTPENFRKL